MNFSSNSSQSTHPTGQELWGELLVLSRFHSSLRVDEWNFCPLILKEPVSIFYSHTLTIQRIKPGREDFEITRIECIFWIDSQMSQSQHIENLVPIRFLFLSHFRAAKSQMTRDNQSQVQLAYIRYVCRY